MLNFLLSVVAAAEELIKHLKSENDKLHAEVNELRSEVASIMLVILIFSFYLHITMSFSSFLDFKMYVSLQVQQGQAMCRLPKAFD